MGDVGYVTGWERYLKDKRERPSIADTMLEPYKDAFRVKANLNGKVASYPVYRLMELMLYIVVKEKESGKDNKIERFTLNYGQCLLYKAMAEQKMYGKPIRQDILKARQIGFSTFIAGFLFIMTMFNPNFKSAVIADEKGHAQNIFRKYQTFYDHLDDSNPNYVEIREWNKTNKGKTPHSLSWKPALKFNKGQEYMETAVGGSILEVLVAGEGAGRSDTYDALHFTECAFFKNDLKRTLNGATETVPETVDSFVFLETTANGFNEYKDIWDADYSHQGSYEAFFMPWYNNPGYTKKLLPYEKKPIIDEWILEKQKAYDLTDEQILWYWHKYKAKRKNKEDTLQEYPFSPVDAFVSSGDCIFGSDIVAMRKTESLRINEEARSLKVFLEKRWSDDGKQCEVGKTKFLDTPSGEWKIFEEPKKGYPYVIICDPNDESNDDTAIQVMDNSSGEQVAEFASNAYQKDEIAYQLYAIGRWYNFALISSENNRASVIIDYLVAMGYPKLYVNQSNVAQNFSMSIGKTFGHTVTASNRQRMIDQLKVYFRDNPNMVKGYRTLVEMESFQHKATLHKNGSMSFKDEASSGKHDDLVMALAGFTEVRHQQTTLVQKYAESEYGGNEGEDDAVSRINWQIMYNKHKMEEEKQRKIKARSLGIKWN